MKQYSEEHVPYSEYSVPVLQRWQRDALMVGDTLFASMCSRALRAKGWVIKEPKVPWSKSDEAD